MPKKDESKAPAKKSTPKQAKPEGQLHEEAGKKDIAACLKAMEK